MPLHKMIQLSDKSKLYLWKINESFEELFSQVQLNDSSIERLKSMKSESHQKGFFFFFFILQHIGCSDFDLFYDEFGKPHLKLEDRRDRTLKATYHLPPTSYHPIHISISHSHEFSAIAISDESIGIDIEILKEKALKIAPRYMDVSHLESLSTVEKIKKATVVWGIKESIFKIKNEAGISFPDHIFEMPFSFEDKKAFATLKFNNKEEKFNIQFDSVEEYIFVCAFEDTV